MPRQAKSEQEHFLQGTPVRNASASASLSKFEGGRPKRPRHLSPVAASEFKRRVKQLEQRRTVTPGDEAVLAVYSEVFARWQAAKEQLGDELMIETEVTDNNGNLHTVSRLNPLLKVVEACESRMLALLKSLGLTPVDRERTKPTSSNVDEPAQPGTVAWMILQGGAQAEAPEPAQVAPEDMPEIED